jgi:hypothetical protein
MKGSPSARTLLQQQMVDSIQQMLPQQQTVDSIQRLLQQQTADSIHLKV